jgi:hypothetical protein
MNSTEFGQSFAKREEVLDPGRNLKVVEHLGGKTV